MALFMIQFRLVPGLLFRFFVKFSGEIFTTDEYRVLACAHRSRLLGGLSERSVGLDNFFILSQRHRGH
jgi:hypothetical protein